MFFSIGPAYLFKPVQETKALEDSTPPATEPARKAAPAKKIAAAAPKVTRKTAVVGAAIGIGSAAIVAALLYANRGNKS